MRGEYVASTGYGVLTLPHPRLRYLLLRRLCGQDTLFVGVRLEQECGAVVANTRALECGNTYAEERERVGASAKKGKWEKACM